MTHKATYALLIYRTGDESIPAERIQHALGGHREVQRKTSDKGGLHAVAQLGDVTAAKTVTLAGSSHDITDGPYIEAKEWLVGLYLVDCDDEAEALAHARTLCAIPDHVVEVRPVKWRWKG